MPRHLFVLYGSATGNAETIAKTLTSTLTPTLPNTPFTSVVCTHLDSWKKTVLPEIGEAPEGPEGGGKHGLIVVCSTTGNGDSPENAGRFVRMIKKKVKVRNHRWRVLLVVRFEHTRTLLTLLEPPPPSLSPAR